MLLAWRMVPRSLLGVERSLMTLRLEESSPSLRSWVSFGLSEKNAASLPLIIAEQKRSSRMSIPIRINSQTFPDKGTSSGELLRRSISCVLGGSKYLVVLVYNANIIIQIISRKYVT